MDDNADLRHALQRLLKSLYEVVLADGARQALEILRIDRAFDVVVSDVSMHETDGSALHAQVSAFDAALAGRFIFLSGTTPSPETAGYMERAGVPFLVKPVDRLSLVAEIERVRRRGPRANAQPPRSADQ